MTSAEASKYSNETDKRTVDLLQHIQDFGVRLSSPIDKFAAQLSVAFSIDPLDLSEMHRFNYEVQKTHLDDLIRSLSPDLDKMEKICSSVSSQEGIANVLKALKSPGSASPSDLKEAELLLEEARYLSIVNGTNSLVDNYISQGTRIIDIKDGVSDIRAARKIIETQKKFGYRFSAQAAIAEARSIRCNPLLPASRFMAKKLNAASDNFSQMVYDHRARTEQRNLNKEAQKVRFQAYRAYVDKLTEQMQFDAKDKTPGRLLDASKFDMPSWVEHVQLNPEAEPIRADLPTRQGYAVTLSSTDTLPSNLEDAYSSAKALELLAISQAKVQFLIKHAPEYVTMPGFAAQIDIAYFQREAKRILEEGLSQKKNKAWLKTMESTVLLSIVVAACSPSVTPTLESDPGAPPQNVPAENTPIPTIPQSPTQEIMPSPTRVYHLNTGGLLTEEHFNEIIALDPTVVDQVLWLNEWANWYDSAAERPFTAEQANQSIIFFEWTDAEGNLHYKAAWKLDSGYDGFVLVPPAINWKELNPPVESAVGHEIGVGQGHVPISTSVIEGSDLAKLGVPVGAILAAERNTGDWVMVYDDAVVARVNNETGYWEVLPPGSTGQDENGNFIMEADDGFTYTWFEKERSWKRPLIENYYAYDHWDFDAIPIDVWVKYGTSGSESIIRMEHRNVTNSDDRSVTSDYMNNFLMKKFQKKDLQELWSGLNSESGLQTDFIFNNRPISGQLGVNRGFQITIVSEEELRALFEEHEAVKSNGKNGIIYLTYDGVENGRFLVRVASSQPLNELLVDVPAGGPEYELRKLIFLPLMNILIAGEEEDLINIAASRDAGIVASDSAEARSLDGKPDLGVVVADQ